MLGFVLVQAKLDGTRSRKGTSPFSAFPKEKERGNVLTSPTKTLSLPEKPTGKLPTGINLKNRTIMPFKVKVRKKTLYFKKDKEVVYVATADRGDQIGPDKIASFVAKASGANEAQVKAILGTMVSSVLTWIEEGHSVRLGDLGSFVPNVTCKSSRNPDHIEIKRTKVIFYPSKEMAASIRRFNLSVENPYSSAKEPKNR